MDSAGAVIEIAKRAYRALVPSSVRGSRLVARLKTRWLGHDWIYDSGYYEQSVEVQAVRSAGTMADSLLHHFKATRVIDVGCGTGALLEALRDRGCEVFGLECAEAALGYCRARRLDVAKFDLEKDVFDDGRTFDVAISMEVAEHLPANVSNRIVDLLTRVSPVVVFTAATPGQMGTDHVNEQPHSYWIAKFQHRGFEYAEDLSLRWREVWKAAGDVESWYYNNLMLFRREP